MEWTDRSRVWIIPTLGLAFLFAAWAIDFRGVWHATATGFVVGVAFTEMEAYWHDRRRRRG